VDYAASSEQIDPTGTQCMGLRLDSVLSSFNILQPGLKRQFRISFAHHHQASNTFTFIGGFRIQNDETVFIGRLCELLQFVKGQWPISEIVLVRLHYFYQMF